MPRLLTKIRLTAFALSFALVFALLFPVTGRADSKIRIMTATTDLASLAQEIGGDKVDVESVARGYQDPHFVDPKPSFLLKLSKTDLLIVVGELEKKTRLRIDKVRVLIAASDGLDRKSTRLN